MDGLLVIVRGWLWPATEPAGPLRAIIVAARYLFALARDMFSGELTLRAMSLVYTTMIAVVPLLAFSFSVLKGFGVHRQLEPLLNEFFAALGPRGPEITQNVIGFVDNVQGTALAGISLGILLYSVLAMAQKVEGSLNFVWRVDRPRSLARRFTEYLSVILVGPLLMFIAFGMTTTLTSNFVVQELQQIDAINETMLQVGKLMPFFMVVLAFSFLYAFIPNTKVRLRPALIGGLVAGVLWVGGGRLFAWIVVSASAQEAIYSGFAIVISAMFWLYASWLILLVGGQLAFYVQNPDYLPVGRRLPSMANSLRERVALMVAVLVGRDFDQGGTGWRAEGLAARAGLPNHQVQQVVNALQDSGIITETANDRLIPGRALARITVTDILAAVRGPSQSRLQWPAAVDTLSNRIESALAAALAGETLADLVQNDADSLATSDSHAVDEQTA